jgi:hypothetical protein
MARKRLLILIILILVFAVVAAAAILLFTRPENQNKDELITVAEIRPQDVRLMRIAREGESVSLVKEDGVWHYEDNRNAAVDQLLTESALTYVSYVYANEIVFDSVADKTVYGLDPAELTVSLTLDNGQEYTYLFGLPSSDRNNVFMQLQGDAKLYLFGIDKYRQILTSLENVKDLSLDIDSRSLESFSLAWPGKNARMDFEKIPENERTGTEEWLITSPFKAIANISAVRLAESLFNPARLGGYVSDQISSEHGIDENSPVLTLRDSAGKAVSLTIGNQTSAGDFYCTVSDREGVYSTYQGIEALLKIDVMDAVSPGIFPVNDQILPPFSMRLNDVEFVLDFQGGSYLLNGRSLSPEDAVLISQMMQAATLDGPAPLEPMENQDIEFEMVRLTLRFSVYKNDYFLVGMNEMPFGYLKTEKLAALVDLLDTLAG